MSVFPLVLNKDWTLNPLKKKISNKREQKIIFKDWTLNPPKKELVNKREQKIMLKI